MRRNSRTLNGHIHYYRISVENAFAELKQYIIKNNIISLATFAATPLTAVDNMCRACLFKKNLKGGTYELRLLSRAKRYIQLTSAPSEA